jgi:DNA helicase-2/ATP-dependent DNA helicase PcrA
VILDNGRWNQYNFKSLFEGGGTQSVLERTQKIFYVCCTRAKEKLAVFYHEPPTSVLEKAKEWFGETNVVDLDANAEGTAE